MPKAGQRARKQGKRPPTILRRTLVFAFRCDVFQPYYEIPNDDERAALGTLKALVMGERTVFLFRPS